ncbi:MAG: hypothetical protein M5U01_08130 [Ardenticatenaceae bacterium]|nr:hypothetical protein [Ardenticatenaceae bacterium]HBY93710.1 hypothetical protein [Chloroflexota bacterium]
MPYSQILSRAFEITRRQPALWVFGFLVALFGGAGRGGGPSYNFNGFNGGRVPRFQGPPGFNLNLSTMLGLIAIVIGLLLVLAIIAAIVRYVAEVALIDGAARADDDEPVTVAGGLRRGWSRDAFFLFLTRLLLALPLIVVAIGIGVLVAGILAGGIGAAAATDRGVFAVLGIGLFLLVLLPTIALLILLAVVLALLGQWAAREVVLSQAGPIEAIGAAWGLARTYLKETILFGLLMWAISLGFGLLMTPLLLVAGALIIGPAFLAYQSANSLVAALVVAAPLALLALIGFAIIAGLFVAFSSTAWTLAWRHLRGISSASADLSEPIPDAGDSPVLATG